MKDLKHKVKSFIQSQCRMISPKQDIVITPTQAQGTSEKETENVRTGGKGKVYGTVLWA